MVLLVRHNIDVLRANYLRKNHPREYMITLLLAEKAMEIEQNRMKNVKDKSKNKIDPKEAIRSMTK